MSSNLPPGVSEGMIPGNRPEDEEWEEFMALVDEKMKQLLSPVHQGIINGLNEMPVIGDALTEYIGLVRDISYAIGGSAGRLEEQMAQAEMNESLRERLSDA